MKKYTLLVTFRYLPSILLCISLLACNGSGTKEPSTENQPGDSTSEKASVKEVSYNLPSPLQIASLFKKSGLKFIEGITTTQKDPAKYTSNFSKSLNLGIYGADLAYCVLNKQNQEAMNYMKASTQISNSLGMTSIFEEGAFVSRFEKYLNNEDSLRNVIAELQMATDTYLEDNEQQQVSAIAFSGAWIEAMYIGSKVFEKSKDKGLNDKISEQMTILSRIINVLKTNQAKDPGIAGLVADLNGLRDKYADFDSVKKSKAESKEDDFGLIVSLNEKETNDLIKKITELRNKFINS